MTEHSSEPSSHQQPPIESGRAPAVDGTESAETLASSGPVSTQGRKASRRRRLLLVALGALVLAALVVFGIPTIRLALNTVSTDDAFVNGHVTFVAPRVAGQISRVLVDDNNRVHKGDLLAELDKEPYRIAVAREAGSGRHRERGPAGGHSHGARYRSASEEPALEPATRRGGRRQPGRAAACAGRRRR